MNEITLFFTALKDFFTRPIIKIALYPLLITIVILYVMFFYAADFGLESFHNQVIHIQQEHSSMQNGEMVTTTTNATYFGKGLVDFLLQFSVTSWLVGFLVYTLGTIFVMLFSLFIALIIVGFLTPSILNIIKKRHYENLEFRGYGNIANSLFVLLKSFIVMGLLFFVLIPFYFIPILNIFIINIPFYYFFYKLLHFDVTSTIMTQEEAAYIKAKEGGVFHVRTIGLYLLSMVPFIALFSTVFYIVYLGHAYMIELQNLREKGIDFSAKVG
ncbi:MAG: EI24 domain-containing protein [Candidatus Marinarcus sp.]|uniref:EI24 domain-containing protein n=1 Tax=Candidatus Marinarcus sp. TaxID=3100987 RepID=UPI003B00C624